MDFQTTTTQRLNQDEETLSKLQQTVKLDSVSTKDFEAVFYPGGHGPLWDLTNDPDSIRLIETFYKESKPLAMVCHGSAVLLHAKNLEGNSILKGKEVTGFSNSEETDIGLEKVVPFMLEDEIKSKGAKYKKVINWSSYALKDGLIITGQNPASSQAVAEMLLQELR